jgi:alpha-beta hydrolase superfamily lysophospholipase
MIGTVVGTLAAGAVVSGGVLLDRLALATIRPPRRPTDRTPRDLGQPFRDVLFDSGEHRLRGWLIEPEGSDTRPLALLVHGWSANSSTMLTLAEPLAAAGFATFAFDVRGHGRSDPAPYCTLRHYRDDVAAALGFAAREWPGRPKVLVGHSMGAAASTVVAADASEAVDGLALLAGPADMTEVIASYLSDRGLPGPLLARALLPFWRYRAGMSFARLQPDRRASELEIPTVVVQGALDERVPPEHAHRLGRAARAIVTLVPDRAHTDVLESAELHEAVLRLMQGAASRNGSMRSSQP